MSFKREARYLVMKLADVEKYLDPADKSALQGMTKKIAEGRAVDGRDPDLECVVVVEQDWPEYEAVWGMLERREGAIAPDRARKVEFSDYDPGYLNDYGGGNVGWWQDYLRSEVDRANEHWRDQAEQVLEDVGVANVVVPDGYAIVPVKPSTEMLAACRVAGKTRVWSDMMAARPEVTWACKSAESE